MTHIKCSKCLTEFPKGDYYNYICPTCGTDSRTGSRASDNTQSQPPPTKTESKAHHQTPPSTEPVSDEVAYARILGLRGRVTFADIKRHYRERMMEYHPDRVAALGPKLREVAEHETKKINAAYEFFTAKYATSRSA